MGDHEIWAVRIMNVDPPGWASADDQIWSGFVIASKRPQPDEFRTPTEFRNGNLGR